MSIQKQPDKAPRGDRSNQSIDTQGGAYVEGTVNTGGGPFIGRDWIQNIFGSSEEVRNQRNHQVMRQLVRKFWIDGVLKSSLYNEVLIRLNLEERPDAVDNRPWDLILKQTGEPDYSIPASTPIIDVFDQMNGLLLVLGAPGSGKTTTLLELADALLKRADEDSTYPTPVVFNLSSWAEKRQPLAEWLVDELRTKYNIPKKVAKQWVANDELLLLLDGLDELQADYRSACVMAINRFHQEYLVPLVVCSRVAEYEDLATQLKLQGAVLVQPLTLPQIDAYLDLAGPEFSAVRTTLKQDTKLQDLATTPLMLNIMALAYQGAELAAFDSTQTHREHLFNDYIRRMFVHRGITEGFPVHKTLHWLSWLAANISQRQQTIFLIERLQPNWLGSKRNFNVYRLSVGLLFGLLFGLSVGLSFGLLFELSVGVLFGLSGGLLFGLSGGLNSRIEASEVLNYSWKNGLIGGLIGGLLFGLSGGLSFGLLVGLSVGLSLGLYELKSMKELKRSWRSSLISGLIVGLLFGLVFGLLFGLIVGLLVGLSGDNRRAEAELKVQPNQGIRQSLKNGLSVGLSFGLSVGLIVGLSFGLLFGLSVGVLFGLSFGLSVGLSFGLSFGLIAWIAHLVLRLLLHHNGKIPWNYAKFLDYCHDRIFLRKVGGSYIFIHRMLMEHFANMTDEDIERIANEVEAGKA